MSKASRVRFRSLDFTMGVLNYSIRLYISFRFVRKNDASGGLFGASGTHRPGLGCQDTHTRSIFIDLLRCFNVSA